MRLIVTILVCQMCFYIVLCCSAKADTSDNPNNESTVQQLELIEHANPNNIITFNEFPLGTWIDTQYADRGIIFGGDYPGIKKDNFNPTSPGLETSSEFKETIEGTFVDHENDDTPITVNRFSFTAGHFDHVQSTKIQWFDLQGRLLGQNLNSKTGIESFVIAGGNISRWSITAQNFENLGYGIDNISIEKNGMSTILFREKSNDSKDGSFGTKDDEIPGFDHSALHLNNLVYESHPGYQTGTYVNESGSAFFFHI